MSIKEKITIVIKKIIRNEFISNVITVTSGTALVQVFSVLFSPLLTRIYGPEAMGVFGVFSSAISMFVPIGALTLQRAIVLPKQDNKATNLMFLSIQVSIFTFLFMSVIFYLFGDVITDLLNLQNLNSHIMLVPISVFISSLVQIFSQWLMREKKFRVTARIEVIYSLVMNISKVVFGLLISSAVTLIIVLILSQGLHLMLLIFSVGTILFTNRNKLKKNNKHLLIEYKDFPLFIAPQELINGISNNLPILLLTTFFGPSAAGFYTMGNRVLRVPVHFIGNSVGKVFYPYIYCSN